MISKDVLFFGKPCTLACDAKCWKAWGINNRPRAYLSTDEDDYAYLADDELGAAPVDPGTYEGDEAKPVCEDERLNRWCARECERSELVDRDQPIKLDDFSQRVFNYHSRRPNPSLIDFTVRSTGLNYGDAMHDYMWYVSATDADEAMAVAQWLVDLYLKPGASLSLIRGIVLGNACDS